MAAAIVDININEAETFEMSIEFWENSDLTEPVDITGWTFNGAFSFSSACIPMTFTTHANSIVCRIEASALVDLPSKGKYTVETTNVTDTYRVQQGTIRVDKVVVCS